MTQSRIIETFAEIKRLYFPRWDRAGQWKVKFADGTSTRHNTGYCDSKARTIYLDVQVFEMVNEGIRAFLIHEICHDTGGAWHRKPWAKRMKRASDRAIELGEPRVANLLLGDIYSYCETPVYFAVTNTYDPPPPTWSLE
jgi:hypothetical protein